MKNVNIMLANVQRIVSSHKISEKYDNRRYSIKHAVFKNFAILTRKHLCYTGQNMRIPLRISSVNVTKFVGNCGYDHFY